jgi:hypothetical protein
MSAKGLGNQKAKLVVYIANRPPLDEFENISGIRPVRNSEIKSIGEQTGNHWRKVFNCFAKLCFEIDKQSASTWQTLRDNQLLTKESDQLLLFSKPELNSISDTSSVIKLICGKTYFNQLARDFKVEWIDDNFAINSDKKLIVCPYFDYRQLSNQKIIQLATLLKTLK